MRIRQRVWNQALSDDARHQLCHNGRRMQEELAGQVNPTLELIRRRGQGYLGYLLWVFLILVFLWAANQLVTLVERWVELLQSPSDNWGTRACFRSRLVGAWRRRPSRGLRSRYCNVGVLRIPLGLESQTRRGMGIAGASDSHPFLEAEGRRGRPDCATQVRLSMCTAGVSQLEAP